jgi:hypothetical protein
MFAPISKLAVHAIYRSVLLTVPNLFVNVNGKPIKLLIIVMPITEPIPKMRIKLKTVSTSPSVLAIRTTKLPLPARP